MTLARSTFLLLFPIHSVNAFGALQSFALLEHHDLNHHFAASITSSSSSLLWLQDYSSLWLSLDDTTSTAATTAAAVVMESAGSAGGIGDILRNIGVAITAVVFLFAGLTLVTASVIIPAAAKELETECKELSPELWQEYTAKLEEGETMGNRPDLMQELGAKLQPLLDIKIERQFEESKAQGIDVSQDEAAWKAIDRLNDKIPKVKSTKAGDPSQTIVDVVGTSSSQWDDDDDDTLAQKR